MDEDRLDGMAALCGYLGKSPRTVRRLIEEEGLPACKIAGEWASDKRLLDTWRVECIQKKRREIASCRTK